MHVLLTGRESHELDRFTIESIGIPSMVLMERAALSACETIMSAAPDNQIIVICGTGNNGADGLAVARILYLKGRAVHAVIVGDEEKGTPEWKNQLRIAENLGVPLTGSKQAEVFLRGLDRGTIVDALFGVGLSRDISGIQREIIRLLEEKHCFTVALDIPSGISADSGNVCGIAMKADVTVAFGTLKRGHVLYPGARYCGRVILADIGLALCQWDREAECVALDRSDLKQLPERIPDSHKGTYGKVLVIAGSANMAGAAILSARAAYRMGSGLVKILTPEENRVIVQTALPDAILETYTSDVIALEQLHSACEWADVIVMGPGMGTSRTAENIVNYVIRFRGKPMVIDADALNLIASGRGLLSELSEHMILTPHVGEAARLLGVSNAEVADDLIGAAMDLKKRTRAVVLLKSARSVILGEGGSGICLNESGTSGMSVGGSGDVLTGVIAGLLAAGLYETEAACLGSYIHGLAGEAAASRLGDYAMMAGDICESLSDVTREIGGDLL